MFLAPSITGVIIATVVAFLVLTLLLVALLLFTKQKLSPSGPVKITINGEKEIEISGGIDISNIRKYALSGVDFISSGSLTHSAKNLDLNFKADI